MIEVRVVVKLIMIANDDNDLEILLFNPMYSSEPTADGMAV